MLNEITIDSFYFWILLLPGFALVWTFRYFTDSDKKGDFEFLGLSLFCGLLNLIYLGSLAKLGFDLSSLDSIEFLPVTALVLSGSAFGIGLISAQISKWKWFRSVINYLKSNWLK